LDHSEAILAGKVGIESPSQRFIEVFGAIDIGNGDHHNFEFHVLAAYRAGHLVLLEVGGFEIEIYLV
jgi:hypothetical protein